jgi:hypothetical protein
MASDTWAKWARNGRLSAISFAAVFSVWIGFKVAKIPVEGLDTVLILMAGVLAGNLGITVVRPPKDPPQQLGAKDD